MNEYSGKSARLYGQHSAKTIVLHPSLEKNIPDAKVESNFLDVACGLGDYSEVALKKGYAYFGFDQSSDMVARAKELHPKLKIANLDSRDFSKGYKTKFDLILINMLLLTFSNSKDIVATLKECKKVLKDSGEIIITTAHPACDPYMQKYYFGRDDVVTKFGGYFKSGSSYKVVKNMSGGDFVFSDYHWTLSDYFNFIKESGLKVVSIDECEPSKKHREIDPEYYEKKKDIPTFLIFICQKN